MTSEEILAFARALPPNVVRIKFSDPASGPIEIETRQLTPGAPTATAEEMARERAARAEKPSDVASLAKLPPEWKPE